MTSGYVTAGHEGPGEVLGDVEATDVSGEAARRLSAHLSNWLGAWPPDPGVHVAHAAARENPGWDGHLRELVGIETRSGTVISVARTYFEPVSRAVLDGGLEELERQLPEIFEHSGTRLRRGVFRYQQRLVGHDSRGSWFEPDDPRVPGWLQPFNAPVLMAFDGFGRYAAGVGRKRHDAWAQELAVTTEPTHRRLGYARELVAQAAERVYAEGSVSTYLHSPDNLGSAAVAEASGFPDVGWQILSIMRPAQ
jgi:GNAT superfamily N-acetyltransferase